MRTVARDPQHETRDFLLGLAVAFATMMLVAVATLYLLGAFGRDSASVGAVPERRVYSSDDLAPAPKPTAVWKFRAEWQKPEP